jgi:hypothetical protein
MRFVILFPFVLFACSAAPLPKNVPPGERDPVTVEAKFAGSEVGANEIAEFRFKKGSTALTSKARKRIANTFKKPGKLAEIKILAWPDRESPPLKGNSLPEADQKLADQRIAAIQKALAPHAKGAEVNTYNMATTASTLDRLLRGSEYEVKESLQESGVASRGKEGVPMAGKGIVMLVREK